MAVNDRHGADQGSAGPPVAGGDLDPVKMALIASRFQSVVRKMMNTLARTGRSGVVNTARDFSCCVVTAGHELLVAAESLPIHVMSGPDIMARYTADCHPDMRPGDAFLHNSPYHGNSHAADHAILVPVFDDDGRHAFTVMAKAHQADCGNSQPTTYLAAAEDVYEEGALIFPAVQVQRDYEHIDDIVRMCRTRVRVPDQWWGDYLALLGAARIGERQIREMAAEHSWEELATFTGAYFDYSEQLMASALRGLPAGTVQVTVQHDPFPGVPDGIELSATVAVDPDAPKVTVDFTDNPDCTPNGLNTTEATARTAAMIGVFNSLHEPVPPNAGSFRRIEVELRENCVLGIPRHPASCSVATTSVADRGANAVQGALAQLREGIGMAEAGTNMPPSMGVISGRDPRTGAAFINQLFFAFSGGAASPYEDGWLTICHVGNAGMILNDSIEVDELHYPIVVHQQRVLPDSEGAGEYRGAPSMFAEFGPLDCAIDVMYGNDGATHPARGVRGGTAGGRAGQAKRTLDGEVSPLPVFHRARLEPGETILSTSCGGGGYGDPRRRDVQRVARDVQEGWISTARAREVYGVAVDQDGHIDHDETARIRATAAGTA